MESKFKKYFHKDVTLKTVQRILTKETDIERLISKAYVGTGDTAV